MVTRRELLCAGAVVAPGLLLTDPLEALLRGRADQPAANTPGAQPWPRTPVARVQYTFNQGWRFYREDRGVPGIDVSPDNRIGSLEDTRWEAVHLPHTVRLEPLNASGGRNFQGVCWYTKHFPAEAAWKDRVVYLTFQGAMQVADVCLRNSADGKKW